MAYTPLPLSCGPHGDCARGAISLAITLRTERASSSCLGRILDVRRPDGTEAFYLGQWKSWLILRSFAQPAKGRPYREIGFGSDPTAGTPRTIMIVSGASGTRIHVDGTPVKSDPGFRALAAHATIEGHAVYAGNSPDLACPWAGRIEGLAISGAVWEPAAPTIGRPACDGGLSPLVACYRFDGADGESVPDSSGSRNALRMPRYLHVEKPLFGMPDRYSISASDVALNLVGFVPLGILACLPLIGTRRLPGWACLVGSALCAAAISTSIELTQAWMPGRDSSLLDLITNTAGGVIGAAVALLGGPLPASHPR
jgi:VanZ family protein